MKETGRGCVQTNVVMLCGIPGSGKSTVAAELVRRLGDVEVIATDVIGGRGGRYAKLSRRLQQLAGQRRFVVLDGTFFNREVRDAIRRAGHPVLLVYLNCPLAVCLQRNEERRAGIPAKGVISIHDRFQPPEADESPLTIDSGRVDPVVAAERIYLALTRAEMGTRHAPSAARFGAAPRRKGEGGEG